MKREDALAIVDDLVQTPQMRGHCLTVEAFMRGLARHFGEDEETWGIVGLLHDADYEATEKDLDRHTIVGCKAAAARGADETILDGIRAHAALVPLDTPLKQSIYACDNLAGLIVACALVHPDHKIASLTPEFVHKRFKQKSFARTANREEILTCETNLGLDLPRFIAIGIDALARVGPDVGL